MSDDDVGPLRRLRPDGLLPDDLPGLDALAAGRQRLLADITGSAPDAPVPMPAIYPRLAYRDEHRALEFLVRAFGFVERRELGGGVVMIGRCGPARHGLASPAEAGATTAMDNVRVDDIDAHHHRAAAEGARIQSPPEDMLWGDRRYEALDLEGHRWRFAQPVEQPRQGTTRERR